MTEGYLTEELLRWLYAATMAPPYFFVLGIVFVVGVGFTLLYNVLKES